MIYEFVFIFFIHLPFSTFGILKLNVSENVRIIGGKNVSISSIPYQVSIRDEFNNHFCGGAIIDNYNILTAAHCIDRHRNEKLLCAVDATTLDDGNIYRVKSATVHPNYNSLTITNDIAIIHVARKIEINNITSKAIPLSMKTPSENCSCNVSGWGSIVEPIRSEMALPSFDLKAATVPVFSTPKCRQNYLHFLNVSLTKFGILCVGYEDGKVDSCQGDSGGPLVCNGSLAGIISWGYGCAVPEIPGIYSDVAYYREWILNNLSTSRSPLLYTSLFFSLIFPILIIFH